MDLDPRCELHAQHLLLEIAYVLVAGRMGAVSSGVDPIATTSTAGQYQRECLGIGMWRGDCDDDRSHRGGVDLEDWHRTRGCEQR